MKQKIFLLSMVCLSFEVMAQRETAIINPVEPIHYENKEGRFEILSYIKQDYIAKKQSSLNANMDGRALDVQFTDSPDSLLIWLPMIGEEGRLKVVSNKTVLVDQIYRPIIPSDWGYFQKGTIHIIQSSHQDIAWMDTPDFCRKDRIEGIILPALSLMKENKSFKFEMEQTLNLMEFLEEYPDKKGELIELYGEGRFGWGATYNQPYEGLSSGEQLVRQAYYGRKWIRENLPGCDDRVANNMDVPGRTWQMPQILAKSGIPNLFVSRMGEGLYDWYSPDGSKVLTFTPGNYGWASLVWKFFDKDGVTAFHKLHHRSQIWSDYFKEHGIPPHYAILMSCDATKPVDYQKVIDEWNLIASESDIPLPRLECSTAEEYFEEVRGADTRFERIEGERPDLWLYIHGPAHYEATTYKRQAGVLLPAAESFSTFSALIDGRLSIYPREEFDRAWMASIYPDHGLGGKNGEITDAIFEDSLEVARDLGHTLLHSSLNDIVENVNAPVNSRMVFNDLTWKRDRQVEVEISKDQALVKDDNGRIIPSQIRSDGDKHYVTFVAQDVPPMGYRSYEIKEGKKFKSENDEILISNNSFENLYYRAVLGNGGIVSLYDKILGKDVIHTSKFACGDVLELGYTGNGAGEFTRITDLTSGDITPLSSFDSQWRVVETGALYTRFENIQPTKHATIVQTITFLHTKKQIDFDIELRDFDGEHNRQYRIAFPINMMRERTINYEVPMGVAQVYKDELNSQPGGWAWGGTYVHHPADSHPREIQNFISANGNGFGLTMSSCVAVADWIDPSREQAIYPVLQGILLSSHKSCHGEGNWYHQTGTHQFHFSISTHKEGWINGYMFGIGNNHPFYIVKKDNKGGALEPRHSFLSISDPLVAMSLIKKADNDNNLIIRLTEMEGKDKEIQVSLPFEAKQVIRTNLIEDEEEVLPVKGRTISLKLGHHSIETFKLVL
ncbi:alpha-mannosidase [Parabacteroides distasonis]|uniref:glycoside hydrolase family 38 N-terminal domain-containing protein n=2 Tax=Parabacteroides distasonis TaxID=823 RepID=UPI001F175E0D|nr:glycosyl hydrolase-related protein [Parabacteroides distasonis]MCE9356759.1 alpha-mannosidase [Parabacteroides distasonis]